MRTTLIAACLLILSQAVIGQTASRDSNPHVLKIHIFADGTCSIANSSFYCDQLASELVARHLVPNDDVHISVARDAKYELVAAVLASLQHLGLKIGYVNNQTSQ
jgi:biopolymer transport protein ExbD